MTVPTRRRVVQLAVTGVATVATIASLAACSSDKKGAASSTSATSSAGASSSAAADPGTVTIVVTAAGCAPAQTSYATGPLTFTISNKDATGVTEVELLNGQRILAEKENLPPGFSGSFSLSLQPGDYTIYCPGATTEKTPFKVTGTATTTSSSDAAALLKAGTVSYGVYVNTQVDALVEAVKSFNTTLHGTDLAAAQDSYKKSRVFYERIEPVAESFTSGTDNLDANIDARDGDVPANEWKGFHKIEKGLFEDKSMTGLGDLGDELLANVTKLQTLTKDLTYQPAELANGAVALLDEVSTGKITGEEERYSHVDMLDFQGNVEGSEQAFANLLPGLQKIDATLSATITDAFTALDTLIDKYRSKSDPSGFVLYGTLTKADTTALQQALTAVSEPLSKVADKVVNAQ